LKYGFLFENDVKIYGIQTKSNTNMPSGKFENDVKIYGIQTMKNGKRIKGQFENDVKIYGIQTFLIFICTSFSLRMM